MHNAAFEALGMNWAYMAFDVLPERLEQALRSLPALGLAGVNVTIPHKEAAANIVDELSPSARALGAVNTIQVKGETLIGHNTDGSGFLHSLADAGIEPEGAEVVLLGAGGAGRAIALGLAGKKVKGLTVVDCIMPKALSVAQQARETGAEVEAVSLNDAGLRQKVERAALVVNATPVGMYPEVDVPPVIPADWLIPRQAVVDIIYNPPRTRLLEEAQKRGCRILNGVKMLVWQGAEAFSLWTGKEPPVEVMEKALLRGLEGKD
jgi:shikimate dehydrogenase